MFKVKAITDFEFTEAQLEELRNARSIEYKNPELDNQPKRQSVLTTFCEPMKLVSKVLQEAKFDVVDLTKSIINKIIVDSKLHFTVFEHHVYKQTQPNQEPVKFMFKEHKDNKNGLEVHTLLYYPKCTFPKGGRLFYSLEPEGPLTSVFDPRDCKCFCMSGDVRHIMEPCEGIGEREVFVFQVPVKKQFI